MKKYFMKGTDNELQFGDEIELNLVKGIKNGKVLHQFHKCKFIPALIEYLLRDDIIEEKEVEEEDCHQRFVEDVLAILRNQEDRIAELEKKINELWKRVIPVK